MANNLSASFPEYWSRRMQMKHEKTDVFRAIASFEEQANLRDGDTVHRPRRSDIVVQDYTRGTAFSVQDLTNTDESLVVNTAKIAPFYVDDLDALQDHYPTINRYADDAAIKLGNQLDGDVLGEYDTAANKVDDGDLGGTAGNGITVTPSNVLKLFTKASRKLDVENIAMEGRFAILSPHFYETLLEYLAGKESILGDKTGMNGFVGTYYGFDLYKSNSLGWSAELALATNPTANDTVTVNGVAFTFVAAIGTTAGNVLIGADADASRANLTGAINAPGTTSATQVAVTAANQNKLKNVTASNDNTANIMSLKAEGFGFLVVSETLTAAADVWTAAKQVQHCLFGKKGAIDMVIQSRPKLEVKEVPDKLGKNLAPWTLYGLKTFNEGTKMLVDAQLRSDKF